MNTETQLVFFITTFCSLVIGFIIGVLFERKNPCPFLKKSLEEKK